MNVQSIAEIGGGLGAGSWLPWLWRRVWHSPRDEAEAREKNEEANDRIYDRLSAEIERLERGLAEVRKQLEEERRDCDKRMAAMQGRIRQLEQEQVSRSHFTSNVADGPLHTVYKPDPSDRDDDLISKLGRVRGTNPSKRK